MEDRSLAADSINEIQFPAIFPQPVVIQGQAETMKYFLAVTNE